MAYIIAEPCVGVKDGACIRVCPVDCIVEGAEQMYIHPDVCIDCGACEPECPVEAIFEADQTPEPWRSFIKKNADFFRRKEGGIGRKRPAGATRGASPGPKR